MLTVSEILVLLCTCPDQVTASELARGLVDKRLAACVNILPAIRSVYRWRGKICDDAEVLMVIKSLACHYQELESWLLAHHPYDTPEIIALPVSRVSADYLAWVEAGLDSPPGH